jgi:murein DD-endopeptidase MepM/ murein hydrolase activator NlpD
VSEDHPDRWLGRSEARRQWSLRQLLAVPAGLTLGLLPLISGPSVSTVALLPYLPRSAHQAYGYELAQTRLTRNPQGREWLAAAERAVLEPREIAIPFTTSGAFEPAKPEAVGYAFSAHGGRRVRIDVAADVARGPALFVDLFRGSAGSLQHVTSGPPSTPGRGGSAPQTIEIDVLEDASFLLRVQAELGFGGEYGVRVTSEPLLGFPVSGLDTRAIQSRFGAERDGGRRAHRGVDIFAERGTAVLAATDAWVMRVETTRVGGNVVWLQPLFGNMRLYYAHLDRPLVERGQFVRAGEPVGTVGNTGNAITTPPHLHFGVYVRQPGVRGGARDPYAFLR